MDDLISRQAVIDELEGRVHRSGYTNVALVSELNQAIGYIMRLPSAQPERKNGKWLPYLEEYHDMFKCSNCGNITRVAFKCFSPPYYYCPNCGADMREEKTDAEIH